MPPTQATQLTEAQHRQINRLLLALKAHSHNQKVSLHVIQRDLRAANRLRVNPRVGRSTVVKFARDAMVRYTVSITPAQFALRCVPPADMYLAGEQSMEVSELVGEIAETGRQVEGVMAQLTDIAGDRLFSSVEDMKEQLGYTDEDCERAELQSQN